MNGNNLWGGGGDDIRITLSVPVGRSGATPAFSAQLWVALEPDPGNDAGISGFTRLLAPLPVNPTVPRTPIEGPVSFELRIPPEANDGVFVTDPDGRAPPASFSGTAQLRR